MKNQEIRLYQENIATLFEQWKAKDRHIDQVFNYDGIIDPECWFSLHDSGKPRILFLLKEAYHSSADEAQRRAVNLSALHTAFSSSLSNRFLIISLK